VIPWIAIRTPSTGIDALGGVAHRKILAKQKSGFTLQKEDTHLFRNLSTSGEGEDTRGSNVGPLEGDTHPESTS